jgi:homoserine kinase
VSAGVRFGVRVGARTPASSANLGPGFDCLGLALGLHDEVSVQAYPLADAATPSVQIEVCGQGAGAVPLTEDHLVVRSLRAGLVHAGVSRAARGGEVGLRLSCSNAVPQGRGLGSSAAAIAIGLVLARGLLTEPALLSDETVFALATAAEGHPDNASAALFGGCTLSWTEPAPGGAPGQPAPAHVVRLDLDPRIQAVLCVPEAELATSRARAMLPAQVPHADAAFNAARAALLVHALTARPDLLLPATADRLHQQQRAPAMPYTAALVAAIRARGGPAVVSGAGPSVLVLGEGERVLSSVRSALSDAGAELGTWQVMTLPVDTVGTVLLPEAS